MKGLTYFSVIALFMFGVCVPIFACDTGDNEKTGEWRKYVDINDGNDPSEKSDAEWKKALKKDDNDPSERADAEWRKALKEDDNDDSESPDAPWRKAMLEDK